MLEHAEHSQDMRQVWLTRFSQFMDSRPSGFRDDISEKFFTKVQTILNSTKAELTPTGLHTQLHLALVDTLSEVKIKNAPWVVRSLNHACDIVIHCLILPAEAETDNPKLFDAIYYTPEAKKIWQMLFSSERTIQDGSRAEMVKLVHAHFTKK